MFVKRNKNDRGQTRLSWLDGKHSFSFGDFHDPAFTSFSSLRVMNEDVIAPGGGFGTHPHRDMEIVTYVIDGLLEHKDSEGNVGIIQPGELQRMSAGSGILHSEYNHSQQHPVHLYQIWLTPKENGVNPSYEQQRIPIYEQRNQLHTIASPDAQSKSLHINQDAFILAGAFDKQMEYSIPIQEDRHMWIQVVKGTIQVANQELSAGDGLAISNESNVTIHGLSTHEVLIFDLP